jgi:enoyl-CoA hydratase/carnithine racemase
LTASSFFSLEHKGRAFLLRLQSKDGTNRMTRACVLALTQAMTEMALSKKPLVIAGLVIAGNEKFFSAGAELEEIAALDGPAAYEFAKMGQELMQVIDQFPAPVYAAISGYCMGGGLDLALACHHRIASPNAVFGHRGAALGLITGWGGTQRLPRLIGTARALEMFVTAEKIDARQAQRIGLVDAISDNPVAEALTRIERSTSL